MSILVITEKPSVAMDIAEVLGGFSCKDGYMEKKDMIIGWAVGHLVGLAMPQDYDPVLEKWNIDTLPILPERFKLSPNPATNKQLRILRTLINRQDIDRLVNACDAGREGELIFRNIIQFLNCRKPYDRLWLSETTPAAVKAAFNNLRSSAEVENLSRAAAARSQADWIVGINATRGYTAKHREKLTVGRVQTPTLALVVNRDREIDNFIPQAYWEIEAAFNDGRQSYKGRWFKDKWDRFAVIAEAEEIRSKLVAGSSARVTGVERKEKTEQPPMLFNLTELQKEANRRYGFTAEKTVSLAQKLYEKHLLTYPRTDSRHLTEAMSTTLPARLNALRRTELGPVVSGITATVVLGKRYVDDSKVTDHTAIVVTEVSPDLAALTTDEVSIYLLVARRMIGIFLSAARIMETTVITSCRDESFITKGKTLLAVGWKVLYGGTDEDDTDDIPVIPDLAEGQEVTLESAAILEKKTQPPKHYNDADLLSAMETAGLQVEEEELREAMKRKGLGTPATRAAIIEKLISTGYITRQKKALVATDKGKILVNFVSPRLKDPEMTGEWEKKLIDIEQGKYHSTLFLREIKQFTQEVVNEIKAQEVATTSFPTREGIGVCPLCGKPIIENKKAYGCYGWKEGCKFTIWKEIAGKKISQAQVRKIISKGKSDLIKGFKGKKDNSFDAYLKLDNGSIIFEFPKRNRKE